MWSLCLFANICFIWLFTSTWQLCKSVHYLILLLTWVCWLWLYYSLLYSTWSLNKINVLIYLHYCSHNNFLQVDMFWQHFEVDIGTSCWTSSNFIFIISENQSEFCHIDNSKPNCIMHWTSQSCPFITRLFVLQVKIVGHGGLGMRLASSCMYYIHSIHSMASLSGFVKKVKCKYARHAIYIHIIHTIVMHNSARSWDKG